MTKDEEMARQLCKADGRDPDMRVFSIPAAQLVAGSRPLFAAPEPEDIYPVWMVYLPIARSVLHFLEHETARVAPS